MSAEVQRVIAALVVITSLFTGHEAGAFHQETQLDQFSTPIYTSQHESRTDGSLIVWNAYGPFNGLQDPTSSFVMGARVDDRQPFVVAEMPRLPTPPDVDGDIVVWGEYDEANSGTIRGKNLTTGAIFTIATGEESVDGIAVSDGWVVWRRHSIQELTTRIRLGRLDGTAEPVTLAEASVGPDDSLTDRALGVPHIDAGWIAWASPQSPDVPGTDRLMVTHVDDPVSAIAHTTDAVGTSGFDYDLADGALVFPAPDAAGMMRTQVVDLTENRTQTIEIPIPSPSSSGRPHVLIDGRYLFRSYTTRIGGSSGSDYQLLAYDLKSGSVFPFVSATCCALDIEDGVVTWLPSCLCGQRSVHATTMSDRVPTAPESDTRPPDPGWTYQPETGHYLQYGFKGYWEGNGGLAVFGHPLTSEFFERNTAGDAFHTVQYFERQRYEWHPENTGTPYEVLLGRLGAQLLESQGRDWTTFPKADSAAPHYIPETGHAIAPEFFGYWSSHGLELGDAGVSYRESVALFGYPISPPIMETNADGDTVLTQYFERAVFEHHPGNPTEYRVLLRRIGAELLVARGW